MKGIILKLLERQTKRFLKKHKPKIIAITGSVGKTTTKFFTATVLSQRYKVMAHLGNHNTHISVPMAIFDIPIPENTKSITAWIKVLLKTREKIKADFGYDVIILELGTDHPGEIKHFSKYLNPDIAVVTAVSPEHMQNFDNIDAVAEEELSVANFSKLIIINRDDVDGVFARYVKNSNIDTYGVSGVAEYHYIVEDFDIIKGFKGKFISPEFKELPVNIKLISEHILKPAAAAAAVGIKLGLTKEQIKAGLEQLRPVPGRMYPLRGVERSTILDDTYNSSPKAAIAAMQTLYSVPAKQRIAILGSMNELGDYSKKAHEQLGKICDPTLVDWLITIGDDARKYLVPAAKSKGCRVRSFDNPYDAGSFAHSVLHPEAVILAKGSQDGIFAEEALKPLLHATQEEKDLVRQQPEWIKKKTEQFEKIKQAID